MARLNVNPTRMELTNLKKRLQVARRGHKLLKDKRDELMKQFLDIVRKDKALREQMEEAIKKANQSFAIARAVMSREGLEEALLCPKQTASLSVSEKNIMSVEVPTFTFETGKTEDIYPYGFAFTSGELDMAIEALSEAFDPMLKLAETEKTAQLLAREIEKTRRRVNALEHVMIPQLTETIKYITMKLEENERGNLTRLMKVKDMMVKEQIEKKQVAET